MVDNTARFRCGLLDKDFRELYEHIRISHPVVKIFYSIKKNDEACPSGYFLLTSQKALPLLSGPAIAYNKQIIVATKYYNSIPNSEHLYIVRI